MSEVINNREYRQKVLKELIMELHNGASLEDVRERFASLIEGVTASEISDMEQNLIMEGMPVEEVQRLCDVHAAVFKGSIEDIHKEEIRKPAETAGHPINTFMLENRELEKLIERVKVHIEDFKSTGTKEGLYALASDVNEMLDVDKHYSRKENLLFPYLEKYGITAPPKVMWGVDDEIRRALKGIRSSISSYEGNKDTVIKDISEVAEKIKDMIFKEENILFPMAVDTLTEDEWYSIADESDEIGYCLTQPSGKWVPDRAGMAADKKIEAQPDGNVRFETGFLAMKELNAILNTLPVDITFIDKDDIVKYFSMGKERVFARTKAIIGRNVQNCHPPASVHIVEKMVEDFKSGKKDSESFWISMGSFYVYIRYFAVRDEQGNYMGTMEVTQDIKPIQSIKGEKRLVED